MRDNYGCGTDYWAVERSSGWMVIEVWFNADSEFPDPKRDVVRGCELLRCDAIAYAKCLRRGGYFPEIRAEANLNADKSRNTSAPR